MGFSLFKKIKDDQDMISRPLQRMRILDFKILGLRIPQDFKWTKDNQDDINSR